MNSSLCPRGREYWRLAAAETKKPRTLALGALTCALVILLGYFRIPLTENLNIYMTFLAQAVGGALYGPVMGMLVGAVTDTLSFMLNPGGYPYFPGYLLSDVLAGFLYGLLWRRRITVLRLFGVKFSVNLLVNVLLGSLWSAMLYGKGYLLYLVRGAVKNTLMLPIEVVLLVLLFAALIPALAKSRAWPGPVSAPGEKKIPLR